MPQMFPMKWMMIFSFPITLLLALMTLNHFTNFNKKMPTNLNKNNSNNSMIWKW